MMKKTKNLIAIAAGMVMVFMGCKESNNDNSRPEPDAIDVVIETYKSGSILRNTAFTLNENSTYYEYLTFTSEKGGRYALYKNEHGQNSIVTEYKGKPLPTTFAYDNFTGKFTCEISGNPPLESYIYKYTISNSEYFGMAAEILKGNDGLTGGSFYKVWKSSSGTEYKFIESEDVYKCTVQNEMDLDFEIKNGRFLVGDVPFFWGRLNNDTILYYFAYDTKRDEVDEVGRNALCNDATIDISLGRFIFADLN